MSNADTTVPMATPPISSSTDAQPQETLLQRGMFDPPMTPGTLGHLDRFEILRLLGEGGMGQVYLAREPRTDTRVAVKILRPQMAADPQSVHRFLTEARHMYRLSHPRILRVLEVSDRKEGPYYVMPYIEGGSLLGQYRPEMLMPTERILSIASQVAEALAHAHAHGLIHRDLKPGNVLLDTDGNAYLTDFGLVRTVFNDSMVDASASHLEGTAPYMSPAVARGEAEDTRCDIYAFGALLYELLAGQPPYTGRTSQIILDQVLKGPPTPLREVNPKASPALVKIAEGCLARELHARYTTMTDVMSDLARAAKGALPLGPHQQEQRRRLPRLAALLAGTLAIAALAGVAVHQFSAGTRSTRPQQTDVQSPASGVRAQPNPPATTAASLFAYMTNNGAITITKYTGPGGDVTIPGTINGLPVTDIERLAFVDRTNVTTIVIPDSVTHFGRDTFKGCANLKAIRVAAANSAYCSSEDGVVYNKNKTMLVRFPPGREGNYTVPFSVTDISDCAFESCDKLTVITMPADVTTLGVSVFRLCTNLSGVYFRGDIPKLRNSTTFEGADHATVYYLPGTTGWGKEFGGRPTSAWDGETEETEDALPADASAIPSTAKVQGPFTYTVTNDTATITKYTGSGGEVVIPSTIDRLPVTRIGDYAFADCNLTSVTIPNFVTNISSKEPFFRCKELVAITVDAANPVYSSEDGVLFDKAKTCLLRFPQGKVGSYVIPNSVTNIGPSAFWRRCGLSRVTVPAKVVNIEDWAFAECANLTGIYFTGNAPILGSAALKDLSNATVYYRPGTTGWGKEFGGRPTAVWDGETGETDDALPTEASAISPVAKVQGPFTYTVANGAVTLVKYTGPGGDVTIPSAINGLPVTGIGDRAFHGCGGLTSVTLPDSVTRIEPFAFGKCVSLTSAVIPSGMTSIGEWAFNGCGALTSAVIPAGVSNIADRVFFGCSSLASVVIPSGVTNIGAFAFGKCGSLRSVEIPAGVTRIGEWAFDECCALSSINLSPGVSIIGERAFYGCSSLSSVEFPTSLTLIGPWVFGKCHRLKGAYFKGDAPNLGTDVFLNSSSVIVNYLPGTKGWGKEFGGRPTAVWNQDAKIPYAYTTNNGAITITKYTGPGGAVTIPSAINGLPVTVIQDAAFFYCRELTSIVLLKNVTSIGGGVFPFCDRLASIEVDPANPAYYSTKDGVLFNKDKTCLVRYPGGKSGSYAIPSGVKNIGDNAFGGWSKLDSVTIPNGVTNIGQFAFDSCGNLTSIVIPESVVNLGTGAFQSGGLKTVVISKATASIANYVFTDCRQLKDISVDRENSAYCSVDGVLFDKGRTRLMSYPGGKGGSYQVPDGVNEINPAAFNGCAYLPSVTLPASVTRMGRDSFAKCGDLMAVYFNGNAPWADENVFAESKKVVAYYRPGTTGWGPTFGGRPTAVWNGDATTALMPAATAQGPFTYTTNNSAITITKYTGPGGAITIPNAINGLPVTVIRNGAFGCRGDLTNVTIPNSVTSIDETAFFYCSGLTHAVIPKSVTSINGDVFAGCSGLVSIEVDPANPAYCNSADGVLFDKAMTCLVCYPCGKTGKYEIPSNVRNIMSTAFGGSGKLTGVTIPNGVTNIGDYAFNCGNLSGIVLPDSVTSIGIQAFESSGLTNITITRNVIAIANHAFANCHKLAGIAVDAANPTYCSLDGVLFDTARTRLVSYPGGKTGSYEIPQGVTEINPGAFRGCHDLPSVTLPAGLTRVGAHAFYECRDLTALYFKGNVPWADQSAFEECNKATVYYRPGTTGWGKAFGGRPTAVWDGDAPAAVTPAATAQGPYTYTTNNGAITITKYTGPGGEVTIPSSINGLSVTVIGDSAFMYRGDVTGISIPDSVTNIVGYAFFCCSGLTNFAIPKSVTCINGAAFAYCTKLLSIEVHPANPAYCSDADGVLFNKDKTRLVRYPGGKKGSYAIPRGVTSIGDFAFCGWSRLTELFVPQGVTDIGPYAVQCCGELTRVHLPDSIVRIGPAAFQECSSLTQLNIPKGVTSIETYAFCNCRKLDNITVNDENPAYCSVDGALFDKRRTCIISYPGGKAGSYQVPEGVTELSPSAFYGCTYLPSVTLPASVTRIGSETFTRCDGLTAVCFKGNAPWADQNVFVDSKKVTVYYRSGTTGWGPTFGGRPTAVWDGDATTAVTPEASAQGPYTYTTNNGAVMITAYNGPGGEVTVPSTINGLPVRGFVEGNVFRHAANLTSVRIPAGVTAIDPATFNNCPTLLSVSVDEDNPAFRSAADGALFTKDKTSLVYCPAGKTGLYVIPDTVTNIGNWAFQPCSRLTGITIPSSVKTIGFGAFYGCSELDSLTLPSSVVRIADWAFLGCTKLTTLTIPDSVVSIGNQAFYSCTGLTHITIPASVTALGDNPFYDCTGLKAITVYPANSAFSSSEDGVLFTKDKTILVEYPAGRAGGYVTPPGVGKLSTAAFSGCSYLTSVILPESLTDIYTSAFQGCINLTDLYFNGDAPKLGSEVFHGINKKATIYYRPGTKGWGPTFGGLPTAVWKP